jgi:hypothetical protein
MTVMKDYLLIVGCLALALFADSLTELILSFFS